MNAVSIRGLALAALSIPLLSACGAARAERAETGRLVTESVAELEALYHARQEAARQRFVPADVEFVTGMIVHHAQALVMGRLAPTRSENAQIRTLAARIVSSQEDEITLMQQWLRERGQPVPEVAGAAAGAHAHHAAPDVAMPGMLTPQQLAELGQARGLDFDRLFLVYMIGHHRGAVTMVDDLLTTDGAAQDPAVFQLASDIQADQMAEIARMQRMLATLFGGRSLH
jgi:uncharacterized protein (DUF305 family)